MPTQIIGPHVHEDIVDFEDTLKNALRTLAGLLHYSLRSACMQQPLTLSGDPSHPQPLPLQPELAALSPTTALL